VFVVSPPLRVLGSVLSWLLFATAFTLLYQVSTVVLGLGGSCANGGPYVIETQCPEGIGLFAPGSIFLGLAAVVIGLVFARGFGPALEVLSWTILFVGLGTAFLLAGLDGGGDGAAYLIAGLFILMGGIPLIWVIRVSALRMLLGSRSVTGMDFSAAGRLRASPLRSPGRVSEDQRRPRAADWLLSLSILAIGSITGIWLGMVWFRAVSG